MMFTFVSFAFNKVTNMFFINDKTLLRVNTLFILVFGILFAVILSFVSKLDYVLPVQISNNVLLSAFSERDLSLKHSLEFNRNHSVGFHRPFKNVAKKEDFAAEALASLHMANEMRKLGKSEKAQKLFVHALELAPTHPDILNEYGEFLEEIEKDVVEAEHLYSKALAISPEHTEALINRKRTLPLVEEIDQSNFNRIDAKRDQLFKIPENNAAFRRAKKEAYFQHIYHTVAIEGNTMTLLQTRMVVETRMAVGGKSVMEHNEILGMEAALSFINNTLLQRIGAITIQNILDIQKRVMGFVDPFEAGHFRVTQVFVGDYMPPEPSNVVPMMEAFVEWLNSEEALNLHPIEYAALAHYKLVYIHPFIDGNGRTSRLLMNLILMQAGYPPVVIQVDERMNYYNYLKEANDGDVRPFIRFVARCTERTLDEYLYVTTEFPGHIRELGSKYQERIIIVEN